MILLCCGNTETTRLKLVNLQTQIHSKIHRKALFFSQYTRVYYQLGNNSKLTDSEYRIKEKHCLNLLVEHAFRLFAIDRSNVWTLLNFSAIFLRHYSGRCAPLHMVGLEIYSQSLITNRYSPIYATTWHADSWNLHKINYDNRSRDMLSWWRCDRLPMYRIFPEFQYSVHLSIQILENCRLGENFRFQLRAKRYFI